MSAPEPTVALAIERLEGEAMGWANAAQTSDHIGGDDETTAAMVKESELFAFAAGELARIAELEVENARLKSVSEAIAQAHAEVCQSREGTIHRMVTVEKERDTLAARVEALTGDVGHLRQSLKEKTEARLDPTMPVLTEAVCVQIRDTAEAMYGCAENGKRGLKDRMQAHGLFLLCDWQDRARSERAALKPEAG